MEFVCFRVFATNICDKISEMINGIATPVDLKLRLIPILKHMHHEVDMVSKVNKTLSMLNSTEHKIYLAHKC